MIFKPHSYQTYAIKQIKTLPSVGLLLDMGLGKTVITLTAISDLIAMGEVEKVLVVAPLQTALNTWPDELAKWEHLTGLRMSLILGDADKRADAAVADADIYVINRENVAWLCEWFKGALPFDMLIIDELSSFKSPSAKRFKALRKKLPYFKRVVGLTGTPASNGYLDLWSEIYLLDKGERLGKFVTHYRSRYFTPDRLNYQTGQVYSWKLLPGAKEKIDKKLSDICVSMKAVDYIQMPDRIDSEVFVQMDEAERKSYDRFERDYILKLDDGDVVGLNAAAVQGKLLQIANGFAYDTNGKAHTIHGRKIGALEELKEAAAGRPLLVYYSFIEDKARILEHFKDAQALTSPLQIAAWNAGKIPMLVAHPASAGHGLNLQAGGNTIVWYGLPWSLELYQQANARLYRQGQKSTVYVYHILTKDTHDIDVLTALRNKNTTQESLLAALKARIRRWSDDGTGCS